MTSCGSRCGSKPSWPRSDAGWRNFTPHLLVELDYGGPVHLLSDEALCGDESVAEIGATIDGVAKGECELAVAMYRRAHRPVTRLRRIRAGRLNAGPARGTLAGQSFRIWSDATISIARLTVSDSVRRSNWVSRYRNFAPGGRRITAGDGNMVPDVHPGLDNTFALLEFDSSIQSPIVYVQNLAGTRKAYNVYGKEQSA
jgi:hypothetical protein